MLRFYTGKSAIKLRCGLYRRLDCRIRFQPDLGNYSCKRHDAIARFTPCV